jgi:hypothetical protein
MIIKNWVYYMQRGLQSMWKSKSTSDYKDEVIYSNSDTDKKFDSDYKECGCLPDCGCKE